MAQRVDRCLNTLAWSPQQVRLCICLHFSICVSVYWSDLNIEHYLDLPQKCRRKSYFRLVEHGELKARGYIVHLLVSITAFLFVFWTNRSNIHAEIIRVDPILGLCRGCYIMRAPSWRWVSILESYAFLRNTHTTHTHFLTFSQIGMHWRLRLTALLGLLHIWWENCLIWNSGSSTHKITLA